MKSIIQNNIKYIGYYDSIVDGTFLRFSSPAAINKMDYVTSLIKRNGFDVQLISLARNKVFFGKKNSTSVIQEKSVKYIYSLGGAQKIFRIIDFFLQRFILFFYLLFFTSRGEIVFVYHSLGYGRTICFARWIRRFRIVLEVEEIYRDVIGGSSHSKMVEKKILMSADAYIFPTNLLNTKINTFNKPSLIIHGSYEVLDPYELDFDDKNIHIVYAGTFDAKKGVLFVIEMCQFLPSNYHLHVLGFGREDEIKIVKNTIDKTLLSTIANITYEGLLVGEEYSQFLFRCHIGLACSFDTSAEFNNTSFPSKILSYLSHDLQVITMDIRAVRDSSVAPFIHFIESNDPKIMADAVCEISIKQRQSGRSILKNLDIELVEQTHNFFNKLRNI